MNRTSIKITGQSGSGLNSFGDIMARALKKTGFYLNTDRDFPSLIRGGHSCYHIDFSDEEIYSNSKKSDILLCLDEEGIKNYIHIAKDKSIVIEGFEFAEKISKLNKNVEERELTHHHTNSTGILKKLDALPVMVNTLLLAYLWNILGLDKEILIHEFKKQLSAKPEVLSLNLKVLNAGFTVDTVQKNGIKKPKTNQNNILIDSNHAIALGAIHAGVRTFYSYPMSPASSILKYFADTQDQTGVLVHPSTDERTAVQMALGSAYAGSRSLVATSGGGFDLMTETISASGIMETPLVVVVAQRPGPGTGLPTWTCQSDLNLAINAGHGEFPRVVIAVSDPVSAFNLTQHALNIAEEYKVPVILLTEKVLAESKTTVETFQETQIPIKRGLITDPDALMALSSKDTYTKTPDGKPKRWLPGSSPAFYNLNADEHDQSGFSSEDADNATYMYEKRMEKLEHIKKEIPEPIIYGPKTADISFIGWGSTKKVMLDAIKTAKASGINVNYLHYEYLWPIKTKKAKEFAKNNKKLVLIEGNYTGQLGQLLPIKFNKKLLKYNGRPFYIDEIMEFIKQSK